MGKDLRIRLSMEILKQTVLLTFFICSLQVRLLSIWTPKSFSLVAWEICLPAIEMSSFSEVLLSFCLEAMSMHLVFSTLIAILLLLHQLAMLLA